MTNEKIMPPGRNIECSRNFLNDSLFRGMLKVYIPFPPLSVAGIEPAALRGSLTPQRSDLTPNRYRPTAFWLKFCFLTTIMVTQ